MVLTLQIRVILLLIFAGLLTLVRYKNRGEYQYHKGGFILRMH